MDLVREPIGNHLRRFEREILRRIFGAIEEWDNWTIRRNEELNALIEGKDIGGFMNVQIISWLGHIERMENTGMIK